ncbi:hypothetical protein QNM97_13660 [Gordonia sp. L191]|uniref:hypothetical protein n=1 Tax=Gordonia sp. L191 TaxID=2982699 RepID=UPI0024BFD0EA|nr:hypothetical protein [Gordonia sp. L191]WHU45097.1 hypothetical protein QNM97_13660 [Gordonia sp. L191]
MGADEPAPLVRVGVRGAAPFEKAVFWAGVLLGLISLCTEVDVSNALAASWPQYFRMGNDVFYAIYGIGGLIGVVATWRTSDCPTISRRRATSEAWALFVCAMAQLAYSAAAFDAGHGGIHGGVVGALLAAACAIRIRQIRSDLKKLRQVRDGDG